LLKKVKSSSADKSQAVGLCQLLFTTATQMQVPVNYTVLMTEVLDMPPILFLLIIILQQVLFTNLSKALILQSVQASTA